MSTEAASAIDTETPGAEAPEETPSFLTSVLKGVSDLGSETPLDTEQPDPDKAKGKEKQPDPAKDKKPEPGEEDDTKGMSPVAGAKWKGLKAAEKAARARAEELEKEVTTYKTSLAERETKLKEFETIGAQLAEVERLKGIVTEYEGELAISRVEATPEYKQTVIAPMARLMTIADRIAGEYDTDGSQHLKQRIIGILENSDIKAQRKAITELASEWNEGDRIDLYRLSDDYQVIDQRRKDITTNAKDAYAQIEARQRDEAEQAKAEGVKTWSRAVTDVWDKLSPQLNHLSDEDKTKIRGQVAANTFDGEPPQGKAFAAYAAVLLPTVFKEVKALKTAKAELEAKVKSLQASKPGAGGGNADDTKVDPTDDGGGFLERVGRQLPG